MLFSRPFLSVPHITNFDASDVTSFEKFVICIHGFGTGKHGSKIARLMSELKAKNIGAVAIDMPAHCENKKSLTIDNCVEDISQTVNVLQKLGKPICFYGSSFGGFCTLAYLIRSNNKQDKIFLLAPAVDLLKIHEKRTGTEHNGILITQEYIDSIKRFDILANPNKLPPLDIVYAENDSAVDNNDILNLTEVANCNLHKVPNADHWFDGEGELDKVIEIALKVFCS